MTDEAPTRALAQAAAAGTRIDLMAVDPLLDHDAVRVAGRVILRAGLDAAYQPIVHLGSGAVIAYEALARPRHAEVPAPGAFFAALERAGMRLEAERSAFEAAIAGFVDCPRRKVLFVNASPLTLVDPDFDVLELVELAEAHGLTPADLVIEVTESEAVDDLDTLALRARRLRRLGIGVAVDDAGAGHASFRVITRVRPSWIKLDRDLVSGLDHDGARHAFIESMVRFARQIGSRLIAEGIETEGELAALATLGVEAGQGYYLARPAIGAFARPSDSARRLLARTAQRLRVVSARTPMSELARPVTTTPAGTTVRQASERFAADPDCGVLMIDDGRGQQVSRRTLDRVLATEGAWDRLGHRPVRELADPAPVTVADDLDVVEVGAVLAARPFAVDEVTVTGPGGEVVGTVPVQDVLRALAQVRQGSELDRHPLSGLLGLSWVEAELGRRLARHEAVTVAFYDLEGFRSFNDLGGFAFGDEVLRAIARCLAGVTAGVLDAEVAHLGADNFALLVPPRGFSELLSEVVRRTESEVIPQVRTELRLRAAEALVAELGVRVAAVDLTGALPPGRRHLDWARELLAQLPHGNRGAAGYASVYRSGDQVTVSTWQPRLDGSRTIALGKVEPGLILRALDLLDASWRVWWARQEAAAADHVARSRFPGPAEALERLRATYVAPLRASAEEARAAGERLMEVTLRGDEQELLGFLDRAALVIRAATAPSNQPIPPEVALLDRLLRQRSRAISRADVVRPAPG